MRKITGTIFRVYNLCKRQMWMLSREVSPNQDNDFLSLGRMIHENSYTRKKKEIVIDNCKFDVIDKKDGKYIIGEIKKSSKAIESSISQLKYYLYTLNKKGIILSGEILVPKEKKRVKVTLEKEDIEHIEQMLSEIEGVISGSMPKLIKIGFCKNCAYNDFCWS